MLFSKKIKFYSEHFSLIEKPIPSKKRVPNWYKSMQNFPGGKEKGGSVKRCIPFLDVLTSGYYLVNNFAFLCYKKSDDTIAIEYNQNLKENQAILVDSGISDHGYWQINEEFFNEEEIKILLKINNPWSIQTPKGYSCMFLNPPNSPSKIRIAEGIVDTDVYKFPVNFPFIVKKFDKDFIVEAGQPLVWVIPFKREDWKMKVYDYNQHTNEEHVSMFRYYLDNYKNLLWKRKRYD